MREPFRTNRRSSPPGATGSAPAPAPAGGVRRRDRLLWQYFLLTWLALMVNAAGLFSGVRLDGPRTAGFVTAVFLTYTMVYLLPAHGVALVANALVSVRPLDRLFRRPRALADIIVLGLACAGFSLVQVALYADRVIHDLYGFHLNGFVLNILTTRGGIESLGGGDSSTRSVVLVVVGFVVLQCAILVALLAGLDRVLAACLPRRRALAIAGLVVALSISERIVYFLADLKADAPVLVASTAFPAYLPTTGKSLGRRLGLTVRDRGTLRVAVEDRTLAYPLQPLVRTEAPRLNIVWLAVESLRADALRADVMPRTMAFADRSLRFDRHSSGGNGTRMGIFSMFYGLHGSYWFRALRESVPPVLMDVLREDDYQFDLRTSARFTYPEFDRTVFAGIPADRLHEDSAGTGWERDRRNVTRMLDFIDGRDASRPFMTFLFFESPHANYAFPPEDAVTRPYLEDFNYVTTDVEADIELIRARYVNSCRALDRELGRVFTHLDESGLLDSTLVVVTGDHGEEFMEHGRWGHNSAFTEEQVRVPLVLHVPGRPPAVVERTTSHVDLPVTVLELLGVTNPPTDYALGTSLLAAAGSDHVVVASWNDLGWIGDRYKVVLPFRGGSAFRGNTVTTRDDDPVDDPAAVLGALHGEFTELMSDLGRFTR